MLQFKQLECRFILSINEDYFHRKFTLTDADGNYFDDNDERALFFARGVLETVIKLRWAPDLIHCHGWFGAIVPILIKKVFAEDPLFQNSKVVYSIYDEEFTKDMDVRMIEKVQNEDITADDVAILKDPTYVNLNKLAIQYADGVVLGSEKVNEELVNYAKEIGKPVLEYHDPETYVDAYNEFYDQILD